MTHMREKTHRGLPVTKPLTTESPIGFLVFSLKQEQKNKGRLTLNKLPACELHPNKPADREELGENKGKHRKEKKNWKGNGHSHKGFFKKWHLWNRTGCYKKEKKKLGKQKGFLEIKTITEIKIHKVGDTTEKIFEKADWWKQKWQKTIRKLEPYPEGPASKYPEFYQDRKQKRTAKEIIK